MLYRISGVSVSLDDDDISLAQVLAEKKLGLDKGIIKSAKVVRRSIDARKSNPTLVYTIDFETQILLDEKIANRVSKPVPLSFKSGKTRFKDPPVIVGAGPGGLFCALLLAQNGYCPIVLERGGTVKQRNMANFNFSSSREPDPECNNLFGLGGAGTFSDGKLNTTLNHEYIDFVLSTLVECGAPKNLLIDAKPHVGTDLLQVVITKLTEKLKIMGAQVLTQTRLDSVVFKNNKVTKIKTNSHVFDCQTLVLAIGHSARDTWLMLHEAGVSLEPKAFQIGVRVEHPQSFIDKRQYKKGAGHRALGAADYKLTAKAGDIPVFSFCMCPGGITMPTVNEPGHLCVNGMSNYARDGAFSSSGIVVTLKPSLYGGTNLESCLNFVRQIEEKCFEAGGKNYSAPAQRLINFGTSQTGKLPSSSYQYGLLPVALEKILPQLVTESISWALPQFEKKIPGWIHPQALVIAPEARASSPVRIVRNFETRQSIDKEGLYPVGEGSGYAGGIMSAAIDGMKTAKKIIEEYAPF